MQSTIEQLELYSQQPIPENITTTQCRLDTKDNTFKGNDGQTEIQIPLETAIEMVYPAYVSTFGAPPWNEGAINKHSGEIISLSEFFALEDRSDYDLMYPAESFAERIHQAWVPTEKKKPVVAMVLNGERTQVLAAAWGMWSDRQTILDHIGNANYSHSDEAQQTWDHVSEELVRRTDKIFKPGDRIFYWDEVFVDVRAQGRKLGKSTMDEILAQVMEQNKDQGRLQVFIRTSSSGTSVMGGFLEGLLTRTRALSKFEVEGDVENIVYYCITIPRKLAQMAYGLMQKRESSRRSAVTALIAAEKDDAVYEED